MSHVIYYVATSVDGYIATADGGVDWLKPFESTEEDYGYALFYRSIDAAIMGSHTFEQCLTFPEWPYPGKPCWVFSRRPLTIDRSDVTITADRPAAVLRQLHARGFERVWLAGGGALAASLRRSGLIGEYIITIIPVILGGGIGLFAHGSEKENLTLLDCKAYANGVTQLRYRSHPA